MILAWRVSSTTRKSGQERRSLLGEPTCVHTNTAEDDVEEDVGQARVVRNLNDADTLRPGEVLICPFTDIGWTPYFSMAAALVTEIGGLLSHGAVVAREYGLPCVVNVPGACHHIKTGMYVKVNGSEGTVSIEAPVHQ